MAETHSVTELGIVSGLFFRGYLALVFFFSIYSTQLPFHVTCTLLCPFFLFVLT